jgi:hypothetical protein
LNKVGSEESVPYISGHASTAFELKSVDDGEFEVTLVINWSEKKFQRCDSTVRVGRVEYTTVSHHHHTLAWFYIGTETGDRPRPSVGRVWVLVFTPYENFVGPRWVSTGFESRYSQGGGKDRKDKPTLCTRCTEGGFGRKIWERERVTRPL